jgi:hypothetical protein
MIGLPGNTNYGGRLSTIDLLIKVACFVKKEKYIFNIKMSYSKLVGTRRSTVLSLPLQQDFPGFALDERSSLILDEINDL